ncbi:MAG TPA: sigma-70 family RNA polymerase sigma factor [Solirubrobacterales bacterium]|nr:sigma-70 family RNA polymerase sigma factor [Solirubrobacterales bacterium]
MSDGGAPGRAIEAVWRIESPRLIAGLARMTGDVGLAEDLAQDALVAALERWPESGVPENPGAWLTATAKNRAIDLARRGRRFEDRREQLAREAGMRMAMDAAAHEAEEEGLGDELLGLIFACCHPVLPTEARVALTLRLLGGLATEEIARAFLVSEATVAQRIVRAKRTLKEAHARFEPPQGEQLDERLPSVLEVIYLVFNEGYAATAGKSWMRLDLCEEALRLGRVLAALAPKQAEVHGLVALMEIQASRARARVGPGGEPVLLLDQDRARWDPLLVRRGLAALRRAETLGGGAFGPYTLQAAIAACHARARSAAETEWERIAALYAALAQLTPSPVVELNRAVAMGMAFGPEAGLALVDSLVEGGELDGYHLLPSVRADLLAKLGRASEARAELERAAAMTANTRERELLLERAAALSPPR